MHLAMFSPLSPLKTAIADYTEGLLPSLMQRFEITLVTSGDYSPTHPLFHAPAGKRALAHISYDEFCRRSGDFDLVVYQLGDEAKIHGYMFEALKRFPGVIVLHDLVLHHAIVGMTLSFGDVTGYIAEMRYSYGKAGEELARQVIAGNGEQLMYRYPLVERVLDNSLGVIVHNNYVLNQVHAIRPQLPATCIVQPFFLPEEFPQDFDGAAFRRQLGLAEHPTVASFGFFIPDKRLGLVLRAFKRLLTRHSEARYLLVGGTSPHYDLAAELRSIGLADAVRLTGWQTPVPFVQHMFVPDVAVHLRYPHIGGTPYTPVRLLGLGVPTIVSDIEPLADLPSDAIVRIKPDDQDEEMMLYAAMDYLLTHRDVSMAMAAKGREYILRHHDINLVTAQYEEFLKYIVAQPRARRPANTAVSPETHASWSPVVYPVGAALSSMGVTDPSNHLLLPIARALQTLVGTPTRGKP
jgi:glycosyltransferase involved in cell wall biosynthesis